MFQLTETEKSEVVTNCERNQILAFSNPNLKSVSVGYDRRKINYPLNVSDAIFIDSTGHRQVQFADIISGALAYAAKSASKGHLRSDPFAHEVFEVCFAKKLIIDAVWPGHEIDPKNLGTDDESDPDDVDAASYAALILKRHPITKKTENPK